MNQLVHLARALGATALVFASAPVFAQDARPTYGLRSDPSIANPAISYYVTKGSRIPIYKRYEELSSEERSTLKEMWQSMPNEDEPPFPLYGLKPIHASMARVQQKLLVEGPLVLIASVSSSGDVTEIKALGLPSQEMVNAAARILFDTKFKPGVCAGQPCAMQYPFSFNFTVK